MKVGVRELIFYISYIKERMRYVKILSGGVVTNEYRYYQALLEEIKQWGYTHKVFYRYIIGDIDVAKCCSIIGVSERTFRRMTREQAKQLANFIFTKENELEKKYLFIPVTDIFEDEVIGCIAIDKQGD